MAGIDDVLERLLTDAGFAQRLARDPAGALAGYELTADDLSLLSTQVSFDPGTLSLVEERISKAGMFGLLTTLTAGLGSIVGPDHSAGGLIDPTDRPVGLIDPADHPGGLIDPADRPVGLIDPADQPGGLIDPADHPAEGVVPVDSSGPQGPNDAGGAVSIKEVDPAPQPGADAHGTGGGGGAGLPDPGALQGFNPQPDPPGGSGIDNPDIKPVVQGFVIDGGIDNPDIKPGGSHGITAPGGMTIQGG